MEKNKLQGIYCTASECHYHTKDDGCSAEGIKVNGATAKTSGDTECQTFKPHCCD